MQLQEDSIPHRIFVIRRMLRVALHLVCISLSENQSPAPVSAGSGFVTPGSL